MSNSKREPSGALDMISMWDAINRMNLLDSETSIALATFAVEYVDNTDKQVTNYSSFNRS